jgi:hypothetical protein
MAVEAAVRHFERASVGYAGFRNAAALGWMRRREQEAFRSLAALRPVDLVLDAGCGDGETLCWIAARGAQGVGVDAAFGLAGARLGGLAVRLAGLRAPYLHLYFHSWETEPVGELGVPALLAARTGKPFLRSLGRLLAGAASGLRPMTVGEYVAESA